MRCLDRQKQWVLVSRFEKLAPEIDDKGRYTGDYEPVRSRQIPLLVSISSVKGDAENAIFGQSLNYDRVITIDDPDYDLNEADVFWIDGKIRDVLLNGGYFERYSVLESGEVIDGGSFDDYDKGEDFDAGGFEYPVWTDTPHDHVIKKIARSENFTLVAVERVEVSA